MKRKQLTQKQESAINFLIKGYSDSEVCKLIQISIPTLWRWKKKDNFQEKLERIRVQQTKKVISESDDLIDISKKILGESLGRREKKLFGYVRTALEILKIYRPSLKEKEPTKELSIQTQNPIDSIQTQNLIDGDVIFSSDELEKMLENPYTEK